MKKQTDKKDFFLSHSSIDKPFVKKMANELTNYGIKVWLDEWDIQPGGNIVKEINNGLQNSAFVLVFLSSKSIESKWLEEEWTKKVYEEINTEKNSVIPIIIDDFDKERIPIILKGKKYLSLSEDNLKDIKALINLLRKTKKEEVEASELEEFKNIVMQSGFKFQIFQNLLNKLERISDWNDLQKLQLIQTEIEFESKKDMQRAEEANKKYEEEPSQFSFWLSIAFGQNKDLQNFRDKVGFVIKSDLADIEKYQQLLLDIKILAENEKK